MTFKRVLSVFKCLSIIIIIWQGFSQNGIYKNNERMIAMGCTGVGGRYTFG